MTLTTVNLASYVLEELTKLGIQEFCVCPGARNSAFVTILDNQDALKPFYFYEERSAAFFALGRARASKSGVAVITTSGSAAGELLPAVMEAHYTGVPLILITADRPSRYRGTGAPQAAEQAGLFGPYVSYSQDLEGDAFIDLSPWNQKSPLHLNVCLEDPNSKSKSAFIPKESQEQSLDQFLASTLKPFVVVSAIEAESRASVLNFLIKLNCPVFLEGVSGLRETLELQHLRIRQVDNLLQTAENAGYKIDGVLRIGGVPTFRLWRDLEDNGINVFSISRVPFKGMCAGSLLTTDIKEYFDHYKLATNFDNSSFKNWLEKDKAYNQKLINLIKTHPSASQGLIHALSLLIPNKSHVYLGNSLPIREWDLAATDLDKQLHITASRGINGIDGQLSTFYGLCTNTQNNFAILGDLTTLYDMPAPWILPQLNTQTTLFVINNGGGKIFSRMFASQVFQNCHNLNFKPLADFWGLHYEQWHHTTHKLPTAPHSLIEIIPDNPSTDQLNSELK